MAVMQTEGDARLGQMNAISASVEAEIGKYTETLANIDKKFKDQDLTEKQVNAAKEEQDAALTKNLLNLIDQMEGTAGLLENYCSNIADPMDPEEEAIRNAEKLVRIMEKDILDRAKPERDGSFGMPDAEKVSFLNLSLLRKELAAFNSNLRRSDIRNAMLNTQGGYITERDSHGGFTGKKVGAEEWRLGVFREAAKNGDREVCEVLSDPNYEQTFFGGDTNVWAAFMKEKARWKDSLISRELKYNRNAANDYRARAAQARYLTSKKIADLLNNGQLKLDGAAFERVSSLLNRKYEIGGHNFGHTWNPFKSRK